jgi:hypothetical protein
MFEQAIDYFIQKVLRKKPVKVTITQQKIDKNGQVNRLDNVVSITFLNAGRRAATINNIPLNFGGSLTMLLSEGEQDVTDYNIRFDDTTTVGDKLMIAIFKQVVEK